MFPIHVLYIDPVVDTNDTKFNIINVEYDIYIISRIKSSLFWLPKDGSLYPHIKGKIWIQREIIKGCPKMWWHKEVDVDFFSSFDFRIRLTPQRETTLTKCWFVYPHVYSYQWLLPDVKTSGISKVWKLPSPKQCRQWDQAISWFFM